MNQNGNGTRPKVELALNSEAKLTLTKDKCYEGTNNFGTYYLYSVEEDGEGKSFFATPDVHQQILEAGLRSGDQFLIRKKAVQNGRKVMAKVEFAVVEKQASPPPSEKEPSDNLKDILLQCVKDADFVIRNAEGQISDEIQKLATTLFIARTRMN